MSMVINTNTAAMVAQAAQAKTNKAMDTAMERLSTGQRINSAADDAAGLAISNRMDAQIKGLQMAMRNAGDAQSLIDTTEGAHDEITNILQRMREIAVQSANDTNVASDRANLQSEMDQLLAEIDRISTQTTWNGMSLMNGTFTSKQFQIGAEAGQDVTVNVSNAASNAIGNYAYEAEGNLYVDAADVSTGAFTADTYTISGVKGNADVAMLANDTAKEFAAAINAKSHLTGVSAKSVTNVLITAGAVTDSTATEAVSGTVSVDLDINDVSITSAAITSSDMRGLRDAINAISAQTGVTAKMGSSNADLILTDIDGDDIIIDNFETDDDGTILGVATLKADGSTSAVGAGTSSNRSEAIATDKYGSITVLEDGSGGTAGFQRVAIGGSTTLTSSGAFTVTGGAALTGNDATAAGHLKATSATGSLSAVSTASIRTAALAETAITSIDGAIEMISSRRADLGAISNRLDHTINNLSNIKVNTESSQSRIQDADFAAETSNLTKAQILSQAATAMLAQANASKQSVLSLLQG